MLPKPPSSPQSPTFSELILGKSMQSPSSRCSDSHPSSKSRGVTASSAYRPRSKVLSAASLPCTPKNTSPTPRASHVYDLLRKYQGNPEPHESDDSPREHAKAHAQASQQEPNRHAIAVFATQARFRKSQEVQNLVTVFQSTCSTFAEANWFRPSGRLQAISCLLHLERKCYKALCATPPTPRVASTPSPQPDRTLEKQLEAATKRVRELESEIRHSPVPRLNLLNAKLSAELDDLKQELMQKKHSQVCEDLTDVLKEEQRKGSSLLAAARQEIEAKDKELVKQQFAAGRLQVQLSECLEQLDAAHTEGRSLRERLVRSEERAAATEEFNYQLLARMGMLREDLERFNSVINAYEQSLVEIARLKERYSKLELQVITGGLGSKTDSEKVDPQDAIFALVGNCPLQEAHNKRLSMSAVKKEVELYAAGAPKIDPNAVAHVTTEQGRVLTLSADLTKDVSRVDTSVYRYLRPNFASLIPDQQPCESVELPFPNWLEVTVRAILDSKYYEHLLCTEEMGRAPARLVEFTYAWLGQYLVDEGSRIVRSLNWWKKEASDKFRVTFLQALGTELARKCWEVHTFKEFLSEDMGVDELGFYLHCRCMLFEGPQLATPAGRMNAVHYLPLAVCHLVLDKILVRLPTAEKDDIKAALDAKARKKANAMHVDSAFALRVLLEYYRREKKCKFLAVSQLFGTARSEGVGFKRTVCFSEFRSICRRLNQDFSDQQIVKLYRDAWTAGNGTVNAETFFLALNESPALFHCLRVPSLWKPPAVTESGEVDARAGLYSHSVAGVVADWKQMFRMLEMVKDCLNSMGCPELTCQLARIESAFNLANAVPAETFCGKNLTELYKRYWLAIAQVAVVYMEANAWVISNVDDTLYFENSLRQVIEVRAASATFLETLRTQKLKRLTQKIAAQKIQRSWKGRLKRHMNIFSGVIRTVGKFKRLLRK